MEISAFAIVFNEEELIEFMLDSFVLIADQLDVLSLVDNGSTDGTLDIIYSYKDKLPLVVQHEHSHAHHGTLRTLALTKCKAPWIIYADADETFGANLRDWLLSGEIEQADIWDVYKFTTIVDRYHYVEGGGGPCTRIFRNLDGVHFPESVHTTPTHPGLRTKRMIAQNKLLMYDHTATKSEEALWAKGQRYQVHLGVEGIGGPEEYVARVANAHRLGLVKEFGDDIKRRIISGP